MYGMYWLRVNETILDTITSQHYNVTASRLAEERMTTLSKRSTIYFDPAIHHALKMKAASTHTSISELIDEALRLFMREDEEDLAVFADRIKEPDVSYEALLKDLKKHGKI